MEVKIENNGMVRKADPVEVWERGGLILDVECWLQMVNIILIERSLVQRKKTKGSPHAFQG
jgi:hypothetical protein